jgi:hypothetical protein
MLWKKSSNLSHTKKSIYCKKQVIFEYRKSPAKKAVAGTISFKLTVA